MNTSSRTLTVSLPVVALMVALAGLVLYVATAMIAPLNGEDFALTREMVGQSPYDRLQWMAERSYLQITQWNARLGEQLAIFWLGVPKIYYVFASAVSFILFALIVGIWSREDGDQSSFNRALIYAMALIWLLWPGFEVFFWITAHSAYFQPMILVMVLLSMYRTQEALDRLGRSNLRSFAALTLAVLVGLSFENVPPALGASIALVLLLRGRQYWTSRVILPILALAIAWAVLVLAPSTGIRRAAYAAMYPADPNLMHYIGRAMDVGMTLLKTSYLILFSAIAAAVYLWRAHGWRQQVLLIWSVSILTVATLVAAPYTEPRAFIVPWALWFVLVIAAVVRLDMRPSIRAVFAVLSIVSLWFPFQAHLAYVDFSRSLEERDAYIRIIGRTNRCASGISVGHSIREYPYKYLNNREQWYVANPAYVSKYYGCTVHIQ